MPTINNNMSKVSNKQDLHTPRFPVRFVTAASLFDGHDAAINIMRRLLQSQGAEVIHLGHNRSVDEIVSAAIEEDVQGIALSSYQGGHIEYFKYLIDKLRSVGRPEIKVYGGGGGVMLLLRMLVALAAACVAGRRRCTWWLWWWG